MNLLLRVRSVLVFLTPRFLRSHCTVRGLHGVRQRPVTKLRLGLYGAHSPLARSRRFFIKTQTLKTRVAEGLKMLMLRIMLKNSMIMIEFSTQDTHHIQKGLRLIRIVSLSRERSPHNPGFQTVIPPGYALYIHPHKCRSEQCGLRCWFRIG